MNPSHKPVLLEETIKSLNIRENKIYLDLTLGLGGHSNEILKHLNNTGWLYAFDQDQNAIDIAKKRLESYQNVTIIKDNFVNSVKRLEEIGIYSVDGILMDIGVSSMQIDDKERGFSYSQDSELDMRMDRSNPLTAKDIINRYSKEELETIFFEYGEEKYSKKIVSNILKEREKEIRTSFELNEIIKKSVMGNYETHPSKRVFQALRIEVNKELDVLEKTIPLLLDILNKEGRIAIITFHSLEDRIVKSIFQRESKNCICPKELPICVCGHKKKIKIITKKPIVASDSENKENPRARSAKLRVAERV